MCSVIPISDRNPTSRRPIVTIVLIALCAAVYFLAQPSPFTSDKADATFDVQHAAIPYEVTRHRPINVCQAAAVATDAGTAVTPCRSVTGPAPRYPHKRVWTAVLTSIFLHGSVMHLAFNMLFLWIFGNNIEDRLGPLKFVVFYLVGGIVATLAHIAAAPSDITPVIGASGAIAAVMGAYLIWFPKVRVNTLVFFLIVPIPAWLMLGVWFVTQFFTNPNAGVAWVAHVGGFVFGAIVALVMRKKHPIAPAPTWPAPRPI
jgi:membrane associated rhomboid family serine protease